MGLEDRQLRAILKYQVPGPYHSRCEAIAHIASKGNAPWTEKDLVNPE